MRSEKRVPSLLIKHLTASFLRVVGEIEAVTVKIPYLVEIRQSLNFNLCLYEIEFFPIIFRIMANSTHMV